MNEYYLTFTDKESGKKFVGKRVTANDYILVDPVTGLKTPYTYHRLRKIFLIDKNNKNDCCGRLKNKWSKFKL